MNNNYYCKYQYSVFPKNGVDSQFVVRAENFDEFVEGIKDIQGLVAQNKQEHKAPVQQEVETKECPIHQEVMYKREGKFGPFFSHKTDTGYCNGYKKDQKMTIDEYEGYQGY